jgi:hypothetical protein
LFAKEFLQGEREGGGRRMKEEEGGGGFALVLCSVMVLWMAFRFSCWISMSDFCSPRSF